jgi:hypothetical protein
MLATMGDALRHGQGGAGPGRDEPVEETGRVVPFRPRPRPGGFSGQGVPRAAAPTEPPAVEDIAKYARDADEDDYRHRMIMNVIGFIACVLLVVAGIWIANALVEMRKKQDCILSGRRNCAPIEMPTRLRS